MSTEQPIVDSEVPDTPAFSEQIDDDPIPAETGLAEDPQPAEEEEEIEIGEKKFALPKSVAEKLKAERMMQADYTRKTQEVAEHRKQVEAQAAQIAQQREVQQQFIKDMAKVEALNDQLAAYDRLDWQQLVAQDPQTALLYQEQRRALETERNKAAEAVTQKQQQFALDEQQSLAKQVQEAEAYVAREIAGWTPARSEALSKYAVEQGVNLNQGVAKVLIQNPAFLKIIHKAELYDQLAAKRNTKPAPTPPPAPVTRLGAAKQGVQRDPSKMSDAEFAAYRRRVSSRK